MSPVNTAFVFGSWIEISELSWPGVGNDRQRSVAKLQDGAAFGPFGKTKEIPNRFHPKIDHFRIGPVHERAVVGRMIAVAMRMRDRNWKIFNPLFF